MEHAAKRQRGTRPSPIIPYGWALAWIVLLIIAGSGPGYWQTIASQSMIALLAALGMTVIIGNAGQLALSSAGFLGIGAYTYTATVAAIPSWLVGLIAAAVISTVFGMLVGLVASRLRGLYLAFVTLGVVLIVQELATNLRGMTGGAVGRTVPVVDLGFGQSSRPSAYILIAVTASSFALLTALMLRTTFGAAIRAVRTDEHLAASLGIHRTRAVTMAYAYSCLSAGLGGALYAYSIGYVSREPFGFEAVLEHVTIVVVGGITTVLGAVVGAVTIGVADEFLRNYPGVSEIAHGLAVMGALLVARGGLVSLMSRSWTKVRRHVPSKRDAPEVAHAHEVTQ